MHSHQDEGHSVPHQPHRRLLWALALTLSFTLVEAIAGWWSGSLALLSDAGHMLTDSLALGLAALAAILAQRRPTARHSYGLGRVEILAALFNALVMIVLVLAISVEAVERLGDPHPVEGKAVMAVAFIGLLINLGAAWLLSGGTENLNVRAALLHVMGDLLGSLAALVSGTVIWLTDWTPIDPLLSLLIVVLILVSAVRISREALHVLIDGVPPRLDLERIGYAMAAVDGVVSVHDLHIWALSANRTALSAHVVVSDLCEWPTVLAHLQRILTQDYGIDHVTLQPELQAQLISVDRVERHTAKNRDDPEE